MNDENPLIVWKAPPPARNRRGVDIDLVRQLREHPGEWALIRSCASRQSASNYQQARRRGGMQAWRPVGAFELVTHGSDVYARYVGDAETTP